MGHLRKPSTCRLSVGLETQAWPGLCTQVPRVQPWSNPSPPGLYRIMQFYLVRADFPKWDIWGHLGKQFTCRLSVWRETQALPGLCTQVPRVEPWSNTSPPGLYRIMQFYLVRADFPKWDIWGHLENNSP